jgi:MoxR-like ATPase
MAVKERIKNLLAELNKGIFEKEEVMALALLSSIAGENIFLLGPPGTAKSLVARRIKYAYKDGCAFECLMSRFTTPDEIFGPVSIAKLKNDDKYERVVKNYLPSATVAFLDELWKAGPSIQNTLLSILGEKKFRNGETETDVPLKAVISASCELPAKNEGLEALWDRFLVCFTVQDVENEDSFSKMIAEDLLSDEDPVTGEGKITDEEYAEWDKAVRQIAIPNNILHVIYVIKKSIVLYNQHDGNKEKQIYVSDRRWRKIVRLLRTSAFLNDRAEVDLMDCFLIQHCIWIENLNKDVPHFVRTVIEMHGYAGAISFSGMRHELDKLKAEIDEETKFIEDTRVEALEPTYSNYYEILNPPHPNSNLVRKSDFDSLTNTNTSKWLYYLAGSNQIQYSPFNVKTGSNQVGQYSSCNLRKGDSKFTLFINDVSYRLKTVTQGDQRQHVKKPQEAVEKDWDSRVDGFLQVAQTWFAQVEEQRKKDLEHLHTNLFVKPEMASAVESHTVAIIKEIEKIETEIREIQNGYKRPNDEVLITQ